MTTVSTKKTGFRKDINGLRAIAVIAVVLFHFNPSWVPGGFAGVDVFFVISGFLMTGIIFRGMEQDNFSLIKFYIARASRIIPALVVLCLVLLVLGWFYLVPLDYRALGEHATGSVFFLSNIMYWKEAGYFDSASLSKWLLHTWSLSVEWQFYIIYPLVLISIRKIFSNKASKYIVLVGAFLSFILCLVATYKYPSASYYLLPTRAWEMMIGGIAYLYPVAVSSKRSKLLEVTGLLFIFGSYFLVTPETPWPGFVALIPVLGAFFVIQSQRERSLLTSSIAFQKVGLWSYSIYLWHWPIVVAIHYYSLDNLYVYIGILLSFFIGFLSFNYIEKIRFEYDLSSLRSFSKYKVTYLALLPAIVGFFVFTTNGFDFRLSDQQKILSDNALEAANDWSYPKPNLRVAGSDVRFIKGKTDKNILFIGASHTEQVYPYVESLGAEYNVYFVTKGGCFLTPSFRHPDWSCENIQNYKNVIETVKFDKIVSSIYLISSRLPKDGGEMKSQTELRVNEYNEFLKFAKNNSNKVYLILGEPIGRNFDPVASVRYGLENYIKKEDVRERYKTQYDILGRLDVTGDVEVIDPVDTLCGDVCMTMNEDNKFYYKDGSHMRPWYARESLSYLGVIFD